MERSGATATGASGDVDIDVNRYNNFNRNEINHNSNTQHQRQQPRANNTGKWQHNSEHRQGVGYRDTATQQKYGRGASQQGLQSREEFRGHADQGRQQISREGAGNQRDLSGNQIGNARCRADLSTAIWAAGRLVMPEDRRVATWAASQTRDVCRIARESRLRRITESRLWRIAKPRSQ